MSDINTELGFSLGPELNNQVEQATKSFNTMATAIYNIPVENLANIGIDKEDSIKVKHFAQQVKELNKELQTYKSLVSQQGVRGLQEAVMVEKHRTNFLGSSKSSYRESAMYASVAEQKVMRKSLALAIKDALADNQQGLARELQGFDQQLNKRMRHNEKVLAMTPLEREANRADSAAKVQNLQNSREMAQFLAQAKSGTRHSVLPGNSTMGMLSGTERKNALKAQQMHLDGLKFAQAPRDQVRQAEKVMADLNAQQDALLDKRRKETAELKAQERLQRAIGEKDSRALGNASERYDNLRAGKLGAVATSRTDEDGLQRLKRMIKLREQNLKILKATALESNLPSHHEKVDKEERRINRLKRLETRLKSVAAAEKSYAMASDPRHQKTRGEIARTQGHETRWGDGGAELFRTQAGLLGNYAVMGAGIGGVYAGVQFTLDLDQSMRQLQAILALTNGELTEMSEHLIDVSEKTKFTALDVMEASTVMGQAGFSPDQIRNSIESTTYLATAIGSDLKTAVDLQTSVMGVYDKSSSQMMDVSDKIVTAINTSKLNLEKLTLGMQYSGNMSSQLGVSFEENMAGLAAMANSGIRSGSTLGTGMRQVYISLQKPSNKFTQWLDSVGLTMDSISVKSHGLYNVLETLKEAGFDMDSASQMWETRAASAVGAIFNNMSKFKEMMEDFDTSTGAAAAANEKQMQATRNQLERLASISGTIFSEAVEPMRLAFTDIVSSTADMLVNLRESKALVQVIATLVSGWALGKGLGALGSLAKNLFGGSAAAGAAGAATSGKFMSKALSALLRSGGGWGMLGTAAVSAGSYYLNDKRQSADRLDHAQTDLSNNLRLYEDQQEAIRKVTASLYEMGAKQELFTEDSDALRRYTTNLQAEFGGLGLILNGVEGDFDKTRTALDTFRQALLDQAAKGFPQQSFNEVKSEQMKLLGTNSGLYEQDMLRMYSGKGKYTFDGQSHTNTSEEAQRLQAFLNNPLYSQSAEAYQRGLGLITQKTVGGIGTKSQLEQTKPQSVEEARELAMQLNAFLHTITRMGQLGVFTDKNKSAFESLRSRVLLDLQVLTDLEETLKKEQQALDKENFNAFSSEVQNKFNSRGQGLRNQEHQLLTDNPMLVKAAPKDRYSQAQQMLDVYGPLMDDLLAYREEMKAYITEYDSQNGTHFADNMGAIKAWTDSGKQLTELRGKLEAARKTARKFQQIDAGYAQKATNAEITRLNNLIGQTDSLLELKDLEQQLYGLLDETQTNRMQGKEPGTEDYQAELRSLKLEMDSKKGLVHQQVNNQRRKIEAREQRKLDKAFMTLTTARNQGADSEVERLQTQLRYSLDPAEAEANGKLLKEAIVQEGAEALDKMLAPLGDVPEELRLQIQAEMEKQVLSKTKKADLEISHRKTALAAGIVRRNQADMKRGLSLEQANMNQYLSGDKRYQSDKLSNLQSDLSNQYRLLKDKDTTSEEFSLTVLAIDELLARVIAAKRDIILAQEKNPQIQKKRIDELDETDRIMREASGQLVNRAQRARYAREASANDDSTRQWNDDLKHEWSLMKKGLQANNSNRDGQQRHVKNVSNDNIDFRDTFQRQLNISGMGNPFYSDLQAGLINLEKTRMATLNENYTQVLASIEEDQAALDTKLQDYYTLLKAGGLQASQVKALETVIANVKKEQASLEAKAEGIKGERDSSKRGSGKYLDGVEGQVRGQTLFNGQYRSKASRNQQARIHGGTIYGEDGSETAHSADLEGLEGMASGWQTVKNAATEYGSILDRQYGNYDAMTDGVNKLADATQQAANKTADLFTEWAMGTKSSRDAFEELGKFVLQMLTQIAMQVAVTSAVSAFTGGGAGGSAVGGKVQKKAAGGKVPHLSGSKGQDTVPTWLMPDEWVIKSSAARQLGDDTMAAINNGQFNPSALAGKQVNQQVQQGPKELNVWVVAKPEDAGNGGIGPQDVIATIEDNVMRRGSLRTLIKQVALS